MAIQNACFISYCHGEGPLMKRFIEEFEEALSSSIEPYLDIKVYRDNKRLSPGYRYNDALAQAICESVCMIAVVVPKYFGHEYCRKELAAMEKVEKERIKKVGSDALGNRGLIIPIVLRGRIADLPEKIKRHIHCCDFSQFNTAHHNRICRTKRYVDDIEKIARFIFELPQILTKNHSVANSNCSKFGFPGKKLIDTWQAESVVPPPFFSAP